MNVRARASGLAPPRRVRRVSDGVGLRRALCELPGGEGEPAPLRPPLEVVH